MGWFDRGKRVLGAAVVVKDELALLVSHSDALKTDAAVDGGVNLLVSPTDARGRLEADDPRVRSCCEHRVGKLASVKPDVEGGRRVREQRWEPELSVAG